MNFLPSLFKVYIIFTFIVLFSVSAISSHGQTGIIKGIITNSEGNVIPYSSVFEPITGLGAVSNIDGDFFIELPNGQHTLEFSSMGYRKHRLPVEVNNDTIILNIELEKEVYLLPEIVVGLSEDPAYEMIRQAIKAREKNLLRTGTFDASVYSKGIYKLEHISDSAMGQALFDSVHTKEEAMGIIYLSEAESKFSLKYPDKIKEEIVSSKVSGDSKGFSFNFSSFININLYKNMVNIPFDMSGRGFVSPISSTAMMHYRYKLVGSFLDGDFLIHKIELLPKRKINRIFHGYIYLVEGLWCIQSADLIINEDAEIDFIDSIRISQEYMLSNDSIWALQTQNFDFDFSFNFFGLSAEFNGHYLTIFNKYNWNPIFAEDFFNDELLKIDVESNKKDSAYWNENRPVPLSFEEQENYIEFDSVEQRITSKVYLDSIDKINNKFKVWNYIQSGYTFRDRYKDWKVSISSPIYGLNFNTIQGFNINLPLTFRKNFEEKEYFNQKLDFTYGISNKQLDFNSSSEYYYDRNSFSRVKLDFGISHQQFDNTNPISNSMNTLYSLLAEQNYLKLYKNKYLKVSHASEIFNGFNLSGNIEYSHRQPVSNTTDYTFNDRDNKEYTPNTPWLESSSGEFVGHQALLITLKVKYYIDQKYASLPYKTSLGSKYPPIGISYTKAIPGILGSDADFDLIKIYTNYSKSFGLVGLSSIKIKYSQFLNTDKIYFNDYIHYSGNKTILFKDGNNAFHLLDYYSLSTSDRSLEVHYQHHFNGFIINKIPWVRKSKLRIVAGADYLYQDNENQYLELSVGIKNIFKFGRINFVAAFNDNKVTPGITLGFGM